MAAKSELKQQMETQQMERGGLGGVCMHIFVCGHMGIYTLNVLSMYKNQHTLLCICVYIYTYTNLQLHIILHEDLGISTSSMDTVHYRHVTQPELPI